jgi:zinc/manganese transport system substrate-binding protein
MSLHAVRIRAVSIAAALAAVLGVAAVPTPAQDRLKVLATFTILGDFVRQVGGDRVELSLLVGPNGDAHVYSPSPSDARKIAAAKVVITNGLGFEGWMPRLIKASGSKARQIVATKGVKARAAPEHSHGPGGHAHSHGDTDPHAWQSVPNAKIYVANIRAALVAADPAGKDVYTANAAAYLEKLDALDKDIRAAVASVPKERRRIITSHEAFGYFQDAYGIAFIAPVGVSTESEASARDVARIIAQIRKQKIRAVFMENISDPRLIQRIAAESGAKVGGRLYSDALTGEKGDAPTYIDMMRYNLKQIVPVLKD